MMRYTPSRTYITVGVVTLLLGLLSAGFAYRYWVPALVPAFIFLGTAGLALFLATRPVVEIHPRHLRVGDRSIAWPDIRSVDRTGWVSPLVVFLTLADGSRSTVIYPGNLDGSNNLLRHLRRNAREALIDGVPHTEFWGEPAASHWEAASDSGERPEPPGPRYPVLRAEDEAEVERLYQRLKTVGHLDPKTSDE
ncbi:MAG: hypothetical protein R2762_13075 [Bryobacteraceae bacterium]